MVGWRLKKRGKNVWFQDNSGKSTMHTFNKTIVTIIPFFHRYKTIQHVWRLKAKNWFFPLTTSFWTLERNQLSVERYWLISVFKKDRAELILFTHADCSNGTIIELEWSPTVDHHAGIPTSRADTHPEAAEDMETFKQVLHDSWFTVSTLTQLLFWGWGTFTDLLAKPRCRLLEKTLLTMGSLMLYSKRLSSGLNTRDSLYSSVTEHTNHQEIKHTAQKCTTTKLMRSTDSPFWMKLWLSGISRAVWDFPEDRHIVCLSVKSGDLESNLLYFRLQRQNLQPHIPIFRTSSTACSASLLML